MTATLDSVQWSNHADFKLQPLRAWHYSDGKDSLIKGGNYKQYGRLALVNIKDAGHMSPHDQPVATSLIAEKWIAGASQDLF